jgi:hypothetical protein
LSSSSHAIRDGPTNAAFCFLARILTFRNRGDTGVVATAHRLLQNQTIAMKKGGSERRDRSQPHLLSLYPAAAAKRATVATRFFQVGDRHDIVRTIAFTDLGDNSFRTFLHRLVERACRNTERRRRLRLMASISPTPSCTAT